MRRGMRWVAALIVAVGVAGCATGAPDAGRDGAAAADGAFPITIAHAQGTTTIPARPQRVVTLSGEEDTLALLGIRPVAIPEGYDSPGARSPWLQDRRELDGATVLADSQSSVNPEQIAALRPDLILATNLYSIAETYPQLAAIAPTIGAPQGTEPGGSTWQELSLLTGRAVGQEQQAAARIAETEGRISAMAAELPGLAGKTFTTNFYFQTGSVVTVTSTETGANKLLSSLGLTLAPAVRDAGGTRVTLSLEQLSRIDADFVSMGFANESLRGELLASPVYRNLAAARAGHVAEVSAQAAAASNNPTILNVEWQLENVRPMLEKVAAS